MNTPENNLITVFSNKEIVTLYKTFLEAIEDLRVDHSVMLAKIAEKVGTEFTHQVDYFTPEKYEQLRKRVLDQGNECSRKLLAFLDFFDFTINQSKVEEAAKQRRIITKKVVISSPLILE